MQIQKSPFRHTHLRTKLLLSFGLVLLLLGCGIGIYHYSITSAISGFTRLLDTDVALAEYASEVESLLLQCRQNEKEFLLHHNPQEVENFSLNMNTLNRSAQAMFQLAQQAQHHDAAQSVLTIRTYALRLILVFGC